MGCAGMWVTDHMATRMNMMRMLQESNGIAFVEERRPTPRTLGHDAAEVRKVLTQLIPARYKRVLRIEMRETTETEQPVRIVHVTG